MTDPRNDPGHDPHRDSGLDPVTTDAIRARQRGRAIVMALALAAFVLLMYFITIARMSGAE